MNISAIEHIKKQTEKGLIVNTEFPFETKLKNYLHHHFFKRYIDMFKKIGFIEYSDKFDFILKGYNSIIKTSKLIEEDFKNKTQYSILFFTNTNEYSNVSIIKLFFDKKTLQDLYFIYEGEYYYNTDSDLNRLFNDIKFFK